jgi:rhamnogalacturonyl hydrolase YesR
MKSVLSILLFLTIIGMPAAASASPLGLTPSQRATQRAELIQIIRKVNDHWQTQHPVHGDAFWNRAAYHTGNMAAFKATAHQPYRDYSEAWAKKNQWQGAKSNKRENWKYSYGESDDFVLFGDWQTCFQVYIDLYHLQPNSKKIKRAKEVMDYQISTPAVDYLWWADGLYMVMPVMTKLHKLTGQDLYLQKLHDYFSYAKNLMHDPETGLFFRDAKYIYPKHKSANGMKDFWARGNAWIFAAIPKVLEDLPKDDPHRQEYIQTYLAMAATLARTQQPEGHWTRSILDPAHAPGPETSGTAFFTYGYLWGINNGLLDQETYSPVVRKSWKYLTETAIQPDGTLGYIQPIGEKAIPGQIVNAKSTADFGVGAFLLAASEMLTFIDNKP